MFHYFIVALFMCHINWQNDVQSYELSFQADFKFSTLRNSSELFIRDLLMENSNSGFIPELSRQNLNADFSDMFVMNDLHQPCYYLFSTHPIISFDLSNVSVKTYENSLDKPEQTSVFFRLLFSSICIVFHLSMMSSM